VIHTLADPPIRTISDQQGVDDMKVGTIARINSVQYLRSELRPMAYRIVEAIEAAEWLRDQDENDRPIPALAREAIEGAISRRSTRANHVAYSLRLSVDEICTAAADLEKINPRSRSAISTEVE